MATPILATLPSAPPALRRVEGHEAPAPARHGERPSGRESDGLRPSTAPATSAEIAALDAGTRRRFFAALVAWSGAVVLLGERGAIARLPTRLLPAPVVAATAGFLGAYARSPRFRDYLDRRAVRDLTAFNLWRVPAALAFFAYGRRRQLPRRFVANAAWGDLIAGSLALPAVLAAHRRPRLAPKIYLGFHLFSFADFLVAVGTGFLFSLRRDPKMDALKRLPLAVIPLFGVPVTGAVSVIALARLLGSRARRGAPPA